MTTTVIVGGVAGGMSTAARLRRRDEDMEIIVLEASGYVLGTAILKHRGDNREAVW